MLAELARLLPEATCTRAYRGQKLLDPRRRGRRRYRQRPVSEGGARG